MKLQRLLTIVLLLSFSEIVCAAPCVQIQAKPDRWVTSSVDRLIRSARFAFDDEDREPAYNRVVNQLASTINQCALKDNANFKSRYPNFLKYVGQLLLIQQPDHELGFDVPDKQYFSEVAAYVDIPTFLLDQEFLRAVSRYETLSKAKRYLQLLNAKRSAADQLIFFSYISQHLGTPDNDDSFRRLLIVVPGDSAHQIPEKWVQFGVTDPGVRVRTRNVSVVSAVPESHGTSKVYFKDFFRSYRRDGKIDIKGRWELGYGDDNCVMCHKSGILPIFPEDGSVTADEQMALASVNERFTRYGKPDFGKYRDETRFGPGLSVAATADRVRRFNNFLQPRVTSAMNCSSCHRKDGLGTFNWPMDQMLLSSFIRGGKMPYGSSLKQFERNQLYNALVDEYFAVDRNQPGILKAWLLGISQ